MPSARAPRTNAADPAINDQVTGTIESGSVTPAENLERHVFSPLVTYLPPTIIANGVGAGRFTAVERIRIMTKWPHAIVLLGLIAYLLATVPHLAVFPPIGEDESWIAAAPYKLATEGVLGSDLFTGYYGMERHHFEQMPLFPLMQAGLFRLFGVGVAQMRALPVACGLLLLIVVFAVGRQLGGDRVGALAVVLMITLRVTEGGDSTGILLLDRARINRYDIAVPVFALLSVVVFNRAERDRRGWWQR